MLQQLIALPLAFLLMLAGAPASAATVQVAAGKAFTLSVQADGTLWSWGENGYGQLGDGGSSDRPSPAQIGSDFTVVAGSYGHALGLKSDGSLWAWGNNNRGQLGDGTTVSRSLPVRIGEGYMAIAAGYEFSAALKADGSLWTWGWNFSGQLGDNTVLERATPVKIGNGFTSVSTGIDHSIAIKSDGTLWVWGANSSGQLGDGTTETRYVPVRISTGGSIPETAAKIARASFQHTAVVKSDGSLWAWGYNGNGQVGNGTSVMQLRPVLIGTDYEQIGLGDDHSLAIKSDGSLWAWGSNATGQLGNGTTTSSAVPLQVGTGYKNVRAGSAHSVAIRDDGSLWSWGYNYSGQLGDGSVTTRLTPVQVGAGYTPDLTTSPLTGLWWNQNESGWGMSITEHGSMIFAAWYTYDLAGVPTWYVMSACPLAGNACSGDIYKVTGATPPTVPWNGSGKLVNKVGQGTLSFGNENTVALQFSLNGINGTKFMTRQMFGAGTPAQSVDYSDLWWNQSESGWGVSLAQQNSIIFATWFTYDAQGKPVWYVASSCPLTGSTCTGELYRVSGGAAPTMPWNGLNKLVTKVGDISFAFMNAGAGTMSYTIDGISSSRPISRQSF